MAMVIRPHGLTDYNAIAELLAASGRGAPDPLQLQVDDAEAIPPIIRRRSVAVDSEGTIVGTSYVHCEPWMPAGQFELYLTVAPTHRQRGIGSQLYTEAVAEAVACGAISLVITLSDHAPEAQSFAEHRGCALHQHWVYWQLPLLDFQETPFLNVLTVAQARGIRFLTLADAGNTPEAQRKLYELNRRTSLDAPGEDSFPSFDTFLSDIVHAPWFRPDSQIVAADGDQWVGLHAVGVDGQRGFHAFTGVDRSHRRQGLAMALTLLGIRYARQHGATYIQIFNDSRNTAMFKMQEKLGYHRIPGRYSMRQVLR